MNYNRKRKREEDTEDEEDKYANEKRFKIEAPKLDDSDTSTSSTMDIKSSIAHALDDASCSSSDSTVNKMILIRKTLVNPIIASFVSDTSDEENEPGFPKALYYKTSAELPSASSQSGISSMSEPVSTTSMDTSEYSESANNAEYGILATDADNLIAEHFLLGSDIEPDYFPCQDVDVPTDPEYD